MEGGEKMVSTKQVSKFEKSVKYYMNKIVKTILILVVFWMIGTWLSSFGTASLAGSGVNQLNGGDAAYAASKALSRTSGSMAMFWTMFVAVIMSLLYWLKDIIRAVMTIKENVE